MSVFRSCAALAALLALGAPVALAATAYVPNEGTATISVIDTDKDVVTATIRHGRKPRGIAVAKDGRLFLSDQTGNAVVVVDTAQNATIATIPVGDSPEAIYLSPDGKWLSVAVEEKNEVVIVDTAAQKVDRRIRMKGKNPSTQCGAPTAGGST